MTRGADSAGKVDRRSRRQKAVADHTVEGARRTLVRIPADELRVINAGLPEGIRMLPNGRYQARFVGPLKSQQSKVFGTLADARDWRAKGLEQVRKGEWVSQKAGRTSVRDFYGVYLATKSTLKASSRDDIAYLWGEYVSGWANYPVAKVTVLEVEAWVREFVNAGLSRSTIRRCVLILNGVMDEAVRAGAVNRNPADLKRLRTLYPKETAQQPNPLTRDQLDTLIEHSSPAYRDLTEVIARTGLRISEARELRPSDVLITGRSPDGMDWGRNPTLYVTRACVTVPARDSDGKTVTTVVMGRKRVVTVDVIDTPKSGPRRVPLTPLAVAALKRAMKGTGPDDLLFTNSQGERVDRRGFNTSVQDAAARGGVVTTSRQHITPHSLRDTFATHALAAGSIKAVQHALGHATAAMTLDRYAGLLPEDTEALRTGLVAAEKASRKRSK